MWAGFPTCGRVSWGRLLLWGKQLLWGRLSSLRPAFQPALVPFTHCSLRRPMPCPVGADQRVRPRCTLWRKPPGLPCRPLRGARSLACHTGSHAGGRLSSPALPQAPVCGAGSSCGAGFLACGRLSSRPGHPLPTALLDPIAALKWRKPPGLPCRRSRRQSHTIPSCAGVPTPSAATTGGVARTTARSTSARGPHARALRLKPPPLSQSPCPPCSLWFAFSVPSVVCFFRVLPPPVTTFPKSFFLSFSTT
jgi:hypothetical protein